MKTDKLKFINKFLDILSSKVFLFWLIGGWILYYVLSAIWLEEAFGSFVEGIAGSLMIQIPYILFLVSGFLNLFRSSRVMLEKGILQFFVWIFLPLGMLLFFGGFFLSISTRQVGLKVTGEGDIVKPPWVKGGYRISRIEPGLRPNILDTEKEIGIFAHEPKITLIDKSSKSYEVGAFPPAKVEGTYYHILNFGIAPGIRLMEDDRVVNEGYMPLRILTFGSSDFFEIPPYPYRFLTSMEPEKTVLKGEQMTYQYSLERPVYRVRVFMGDQVIYEGDSRNGIQFDNFTLQFFRPTYWIMLEAVKDTAMPLLRLSLLLIALGIPLSLVRLIVIKKPE
jgi:hypothetical protein